MEDGGVSSRGHDGVERYSLISILIVDDVMEDIGELIFLHAVFHVRPDGVDAKFGDTDGFSELFHFSRTLTKTEGGDEREGIIDDDLAISVLKDALHLSGIGVVSNLDFAVEVKINAAHFAIGVLPENEVEFCWERDVRHDIADAAYGASFFGLESLAVPLLFSFVIWANEKEFLHLAFAIKEKKNAVRLIDAG
jgi:hypothetical protein